MLGASDTILSAGCAIVTVRWRSSTTLSVRGVRDERTGSGRSRQREGPCGNAWSNIAPASARIKDASAPAGGALRIDFPSFFAVIPLSSQRARGEVDKFVIQGGKRLAGTVSVSGAKNATLALMPAAILGSGISHLRNTPSLRDVTTMTSLLKTMGMRIDFRDNLLTLDSTSIDRFEAPVRARQKNAGVDLRPWTARRAFREGESLAPGRLRVGTPSRQPPYRGDPEARCRRRHGRGVHYREGLHRCAGRGFISTCRAWGQQGTS